MKSRKRNSVYLVTIIFCGDDQKSRETILIGDSMEIIQSKIASVKKILQKNHLSFVGHIIEEIDDVDTDKPEDLDFFNPNNKITH